MTQVELNTIAQKAVSLGAKTEIVGAWVWAEFSGKPTPEVRQSMKALKFHWNRKRGVWQYAGIPSHHSPADSWSVKAKYGSVAVNQDENIAA